MTENSITIKEAAVKARVHYNTVRAWILDGFRGRKLYAERAGRGFRINPSTFDNFLRDTKEEQC